MIIPEDYAQVNVRYTGPDVPLGAEWTFGVSLNVFSGTPIQLGEAVDDALGAADIQSLTATGNTISEIGVKYGPNETGPAADWTAARPCNGGTGGESPAAASLVKKLTGHGGRRGRGRFYIPGVPSSAFGVGGLCSGVYLADAQGMCDAFLAQLLLADLGMVVLHGPEHGGESPYLVTSLQFESRIATQRRRNRK